MNDGPATSLSVIVVSHNAREALRRTLPALLGELRTGDELIVVDNDSRDGTPDVVRELAPAAKVIETGANLGFPAACNRGVAAGTGELILFLNPDAAPRPGFREAIERPLAEGRGWSAWQGLVTAEQGRVVNSDGGIVHFTGIAWAGGAGKSLVEPAAAAGNGSGPAASGGPPREVPFVSGACLAIPRPRWEEAGPFAEHYFLYHDDVDLSFRLRLRGGRLGIEPSAVVDHEYEFAKGPAKWRYLERNRWATAIRTYPAALLLLIAPAMLATELALVPISVAAGWGRQKLLSWADVARALPTLLRERRAIQSTRGIGAAEFARALTADLGSPYLGRVAGSRLLGAALRAYWSVVCGLLGAGSRSAAGP